VSLVTLDFSPSPTPSASHASTNDDAATQQLITEARSPVQKPPVSSAVIGANLLNAARIDHRHSSPAGMARKNGAGKLRRVTIVPEGPRQDLARRRNLYDIELSPEKGHYALPEKVNHKPLKVARKKKRAEEQSDVPAFSSELPGTDVNDLLLDREEQQPTETNGDQEHIHVDEPHLPSSPPRVAQAGSDTVVAEDTDKGTDNAHAAMREDVQIEHTLSNGKTRCTVVSYRYDEQSGARYQQCSMSSQSRTDVGPRCGIHMRKPAAVQCGGLTVEGVCAARCTKNATVETVHGARCPAHAKSSGIQQKLQWHKPVIVNDNHSSSQATSKRKAESDHNDKRPAKVQRSQRQKADAPAQVRIPVRKSTEQPTAKGNTGDEDAVANLEDDMRDIVQEEEPDSARAGNRTRTRRPFADNAGSTRQNPPAEKRKAKGVSKHKKQAAAEEAPVQDPEDKRSDAEVQDLDTAQAEESDSAPTGKRTRTRKQTADNDQSAPQQKPTRITKAKKASPHTRQATVEGESVEELQDKESDAEVQQPNTNEGQDPESDAETQDSSTNEDKDSEGIGERPGTIAAVFKFLELGKCPGKYKSKHGPTIRRICKEICTQLEDEDTSVETVMEDLEKLQRTLNKISPKVEESDRQLFKVDAYGHIFRALTRYLQALYQWSERNYGTIEESLDAMRILSSLMHEILAFKDTITKWNVSIPQRYKGDRIIRDVDTGLIAHFRQVEKRFRVRLSRLEATERSRIQRQQLLRQMEERQEEERRRMEAAESRKQRRERWRGLHIVRMNCEPVLNKRLKFTITWPAVVEETDANGVAFERLAVFKPRSTPPQSRVSALSGEREWSEEQESCLIDGFKEFAGHYDGMTFAPHAIYM
jgi:hypothetical protein